MNFIYPEKENIKKIKMIVCDLDGTLYDHQNHISNQTIELLIQLQQSGYTLVLATGRYYAELQNLIQLLKLKDYHGFVVCTNGVELYDVSKNKMIHAFSYVNHQDALKMIQQAKQKHIMSYYYDCHQYHVIADNVNFLLIQLLKIILYPIHILTHHHLIDGLYRLSFQKEVKDVKQFHKLCFFASSKKINKWTKYINLKYPAYVFYSVNPKVTELVHQSVSKYNAVEYIVRYLNMSMSQVLAFGDSGNDIVLLQKSGIGVAMKNAQKDVFKATPYQTQYTNNEDGIYYYLKDLFSI